ncbi:MAG: 3-hydroxyanthranilate 3,4-dioxygenase [Pyrinomonadaceae bacterium]
MSIRRPFNFKQWLDDHRHLLRPPVGNQCVYDADDFIVMVVGGPNSRKDYHWDEGEELFYQLQGDILVKVQEDGKSIDIPIREGEIFLLPPRIPHNPIRGENTIGIVIERKRRPGELDGLLWFCENCNEKLYEEYFQLEDITTQFQSVFSRFYGSEELRKCRKCGAVMEPPAVIA